MVAMALPHFHIRTAAHDPRQVAIGQPLSLDHRQLAVQMQARTVGVRERCPQAGGFGLEVDGVIRGA